MSLTINREDAKNLTHACEGETIDAYTVVQESEWTEDYKCFLKHVIFMKDNKHYRLDCYKSGSDYTDWHYFYEAGDCFRCLEVAKVAKLVKVVSWEIV